MRSYTEKQTAKWLMKPIKILIAVLLSAILFFSLTLIFGALIANTAMPESFESIIIVCISAITSIVLAALLVVMSDLKGIFGAILSFALMFAFKLIITAVIAKTIRFGNQGMINLLFTALFCFAGSVVGSNIKK